MLVTLRGQGVYRLQATEYYIYFYVLGIVKSKV